ncbi:hypothetical protein J5S49_03080 [Virgibacillus halodenitrificans]|uniref:hypothetical protein n=1 Tax=Virgibacillus halodenitrificans TaxID=1482 RepID=UPI001F1E3BB2|nr:hypothetical protein [Virgibacillus halodenitrificans]MCG1027276.1 hypothetical protein [Virgibacillus halodenitrificans]
MTLSYTNFRGEAYYLHSSTTKKGNLTYHFSKKVKDNAIDQLPNGYEIYENPNGKVYLRKEQKQIVNEQEIQTIKESLKKHSPIKDIKLDVKKEYIYIYYANKELGEVLPFTDSHTQDKYKQYETELRLELIDEDERCFVMERFCFLGDIDDWIDLEDSTDLEALLAKYAPHIGQETLFEFW